MSVVRNYRYTNPLIIKPPEDVIKNELMKLQKGDGRQQNVHFVIRKGGKEYYLRAPPQMQNLTHLKKASREKRDIVNTTMGSTSIHTQNEALLSKSVDSSTNDRKINQNFETERQPNVIFNQFKTFTGGTYTNNLEK